MWFSFCLMKLCFSWFYFPLMQLDVSTSLPTIKQTPVQVEQFHSDWIPEISVLQELSFSFHLNLKHSTPSSLSWELILIISIKHWYLSVDWDQHCLLLHHRVCAPHKSHQQGAEWEWYVTQALLTIHILSSRGEGSVSSEVSPIP